MMEGQAVKNGKEHCIKDCPSGATSVVVDGSRAVDSRNLSVEIFNKVISTKENDVSLSYVDNKFRRQTSLKVLCDTRKASSNGTLSLAL